MKLALLFLSEDSRLTDPNLLYGTRDYMPPEMVPVGWRLAKTENELEKAKESGDRKAIEKYSRELNSLKELSDEWEERGSPEPEDPIPFPWDPHGRMVTNPEYMIVYFLKANPRKSYSLEELIGNIAPYLHKLRERGLFEIPTTKDLKRLANKLVKQGLVRFSERYQIA